MAKPLQRIMHYIREHGMVSPPNIEGIGLPREYLVRLHRQGKLKLLWPWNLHRAGCQRYRTPLLR
jgi:hypothetical protein